MQGSSNTTPLPRKKSASTRAAKKQENVSVLKQMKYGIEVGDFLPAGLMEKCKCYKNHDMYMDFIKSDEFRLRKISSDTNIKEILQILKKSDGDKFDGGVVLGKQKHPIEDGSVILRLFTCDGRLVAATVHDSIVDQYKREHPAEFETNTKQSN